MPTDGVFQPHDWSCSWVLMDVPGTGWNTLLRGPTNSTADSLSRAHTCKGCDGQPLNDSLFDKKPGKMHVMLAYVTFSLPVIVQKYRANDACSSFVQDGKCTAT